MFTTFDKALAALIIPVLIGAVEMLGINPTMTVGDLIDFVVIGIVTSMSVYFASNRPQ